MAIDDLQTWKDELENLPKTDDNSWALNFANWYRDRIAGIFPVAASLVPTGWAFSFAVASFKTALEALSPTDQALTGITAFANAWEIGLLASSAAAAPGTFIPPASDTTIFSVINSVTIDPPSIAAGKAKILELISAPPVNNAQDSLFPEKFRDATLLLSVTVSGLDSDSDSGPSPLVAAAVPLE